MSELEALSNKELRAKCQEYGMPNVPVTDSSRKILIRRLEAAMAKPKPNRRETMHVSKPSEIASSPKISINNNTTTNTTVNKATPGGNRPSRRTIAVPERHVATTTTVSEPEYSDVSPDRGEEQQKTIQMPKAKTPEKPAASLYPKLPTKEPSPKPQILSKTGVVTTSFVQESQKKVISNTYAVPDDIDSAEEEIQEVKMSTMAPPLTSYVPLSESKVTTSNPLSASLSSSTRYSSLGSTSSPYSQIQAPTSYTTSSVSTSSNVRKTYAAPTTSSSYGQYSRMAVPPSSKYVEYEDADMEDEMEDDDREYMEDEDDVVVVQDSPEGKDIQTPFLSQFARNLENLKATPLRHSIGPTKITPPKSSAALRNREAASGSTAYTRRTMGAYGGPSNIAPRRSLKVSQADEDSPFRQFMMSMEEKYHLKQTFFLISIFIIAVFIYVFLIQSV